MNEKTINNWLLQSDYDFQTAEAMLRTGRYLYVAFMCQQSVEKLFKALFVRLKAQTPAYTHNLIKLVDDCSLTENIPAEYYDFIIELNAYYIETRYNEDIIEISRKLGPEEAESIYNKAVELIRWLKNNIL